MPKTPQQHAEIVLGQCIVRIDRHSSLQMDERLTTFSFAKEYLAQIIEHPRIMGSQRIRPAKRLFRQAQVAPVFVDCADIEIDPEVFRIKDKSLFQFRQGRFRLTPLPIQQTEITEQIDIVGPNGEDLPVEPFRLVI